MADIAGIKRRTNVLARIPFKLPDTIENVTFDINPAASEKQIIAYIRKQDGTMNVAKCDAIPELSFNEGAATVTFTFTKIS